MQDQPRWVELLAGCYIVISLDHHSAEGQQWKYNLLIIQGGNFAGKRPERGKLFSILIVNQSIFAIVNTTN